MIHFRGLHVFRREFGIRLTAIVKPNTRLLAGIEQTAGYVFYVRAHSGFRLQGVATADGIQNGLVLLRIVLPSLRREYSLSQLAPCSLPSYRVEAIENRKQESIARDQTQCPVELPIPGLPRCRISRGSSFLN